MIDPCELCVVRRRFTAGERLPDNTCAGPINPHTGIPLGKCIYVGLSRRLPGVPPEPTPSPETAADPLAGLIAWMDRELSGLPEEDRP